MKYIQSQWILLFYVYCMLGWLWESCYVSIKHHRWVNRGYLYGPWLPIYGSGAVLILFITIPVKENNILIFFTGMLGASLLEYVTGMVMEKLFQIRYWDYSKEPFNINGYISIGTSLVWGVFSVLLVNCLHPQVERLIIWIPVWATDILSLCLTILFVIDTVKSTQAALNIKELLQKLSHQNEKLLEIEYHLNSAIEQLNCKSEIFRDKMLEIEKAFAAKKEQMLQEWMQFRSDRRMEVFVQKRRQSFYHFSMLWEKIDASIMEISLHLQETLPEKEHLYWQALYDSMQQFRRSVRWIEAESASRKDHDYKKAVSILERNPGAVSKKYTNAFAELRKLIKTR